MSGSPTDLRAAEGTAGWSYTDAVRSPDFIPGEGLGGTLNELLSGRRT